MDEEKTNTNKDKPLYNSSYSDLNNISYENTTKNNNEGLKMPLTNPPFVSILTIPPYLPTTIIPLADAIVHDIRGYNPRMIGYVASFMKDVNQENNNINNKCCETLASLLEEIKNKLNNKSSENLVELLRDIKDILRDIKSDIKDLKIK